MARSWISVKEPSPALHPPVPAHGATIQARTCITSSSRPNPAPSPTVPSATAQKCRADPSGMHPATELLRFTKTLITKLSFVWNTHDRDVGHQRTDASFLRRNGAVEARLH